MKKRTKEQQIARFTALVQWLGEHDLEALAVVETLVDGIQALSRRRRTELADLKAAVVAAVE